MAKQSNVVSTGRSSKLKAKWDDTTKGADGLTYRERQSKLQSERMKALHARGSSPAQPAGSSETPAAAPAASSSSGGTVVLGTPDPPTAEKLAVQQPQTPATPASRPAAPAAPAAQPNRRTGHVFR